MFLRYTYFNTAEAIGDDSDPKSWDRIRVHTSLIASEYQYWVNRLSGTTAVQFKLTPTIGHIPRAECSLLTPILMLRPLPLSGSVVMPYAGDDFVEPTYCSGMTAPATPHAGQVFADLVRL